MTSLIEEARKTRGHKIKKEAVTQALEEYIRYHKQQRILEDFGTLDFDPAYDYKAARRRKGQLMVLVDTPVWSLSLRRRGVDLPPLERHLTQTLYQLIRQRNVQLLGATRQ
jgi:Bacterial antitoxin of type II TA system, VapB